MLRPVPAPFHVSLPMEAYPANRLARLIDLSFGGLALLAACAVWAGAARLGTPPDPATVLAYSSAGLLVPSLVGLWVMRHAEDAPRLALARIYESVLRRLAQGDRLAVPAAGGGEGYAALAGLLGDLAVMTRKLRGAWSRDAGDGGRLQHAVNAARGRARALADSIGQDAAALDAAAIQAEREDASLARSVGEAERSFEWTQGAVDRALQGVTGLTEAVRATTTGTRRMEELATRLSLGAHGAQTVFAGLEARLGGLDASLGQIDRAARSVGALASASVAAAKAGLEGADLASVGQELLRFVDATKATLDESLAVLRSITAETAEATRRVAEIDAMVQSQHEAGTAMSRAVDQQGEEIGRLLKDIYEARSGFAALRAGVDAVSRAGATRTQSAAALRDAAGKLPTHADAVASLLRDIPDFRPAQEF